MNLSQPLVMGGAVPERFIYQNAVWNEARTILVLDLVQIHAAQVLEQLLILLGRDLERLPSCSRTHAGITTPGLEDGIQDVMRRDNATSEEIGHVQDKLRKGSLPDVRCILMKFVSLVFQCSHVSSAA